MAVTAITPISLVLNTASADHADANATAIATGADGFSVAASNIGNASRLLFKFVETAGGAETVTIDAGGQPPAMLQDLGNITVTLAANDVKYIALEAARVVSATGTITGTCTNNATTKMTVFILPLGMG